MSLRSGTSVWQTLDTPQIEAPPLAGDVECEVVVLGGGITGALVAAHLGAEGIETVLVDKRELGTGSTAACTGLLQYEADTPLIDLIAKIGEAAAVHAYARGVKAIDELEALVFELDDACGFSRHESFYFSSHFWHNRRLRREYECRRDHGFDVSFLRADEIARDWTISSTAAIRSRGDAQVDPVRLTQALLRRASRQGVRLFARTEVSKIDDAGPTTVLHTPSGRITAERLVFAVGYDSYRYLPRGLGSLHSTYAVASEPLKDTAGWPGGTLVWETARPYFYARQTDDGRAIIGGADTSFSTDHWREDLLQRKAAKLAKRFRRLFPAIKFTPEFAWAGVFGESKDGLPYIGQIPERPRAYFAIGYGGNGITFSMIAAKLITDLYLRRPNADAEVFRFGR